jgi:hypothetical protein
LNADSVEGKPTMPDTEKNGQPPFLLSRHGLVLVGFLAIAGYFLWTEHEAHIRGLFPYWPWLLVALCPLMHLFMHGGHGHGHDDHRESRDGDER